MPLIYTMDHPKFVVLSKLYFTKIDGGLNFDLEIKETVEIVIVNLSTSLLFPCLRYLLITFANSLDPDQAQQKFKPDLIQKS